MAARGSTGQVGRPPGTDTGATRRRIVNAARGCFAAQGYAATTNRMIADQAGMTAAAVYHHYGTKSELMVAVYHATEAVYSERIRTAVESARGFGGKLEALFEIIHQIARADPLQVRFFAVAQDEARRHQELAEILLDRTFPDLFGEIIDTGLESGALHPRHRAAVRGAIAATSTGLALIASQSSASAHRAATDGCKMMASALLGHIGEPERPGS